MLPLEFARRMSEVPSPLKSVSRRVSERSVTVPEKLPAVAKVIKNPKLLGVADALFGSTTVTSMLFVPVGTARDCSG